MQDIPDGLSVQPGTAYGTLFNERSDEHRAEAAHLLEQRSDMQACEIRHRDRLYDAVRCKDSRLSNLPSSAEEDLLWQI